MQGSLLLENLLEWSRSQTGRLEMTPSDIEIAELVDDNIDLIYNNASNKKLELNNRIDKKVKAYADSNMTNTIIRNLLSNAIKYTATGGKIEITSKIENNYVEVTVSDTGVGIKEENIGKLFRIDENFSTKGTNDETGTGLGLILCKEFVKKNGGDIWVTSKLGKGSNFTFKLPAQKP